MNLALTQELYRHLDAMPIVDIHTHVNWKRPTAKSIADILSYHYYTELANSSSWQGAGAPEERFPFHDPLELTRRVYALLPNLRNTVQYDWLMTISREFLGIAASEWTTRGAEAIFRRSQEVMARDDWPDEVIERSGIRKVFLTNEFDDDLERLDNSLYRPCLRTEAFVTNIHEGAVRDRLRSFLRRPISALSDVTEAIALCFARFAEHGMAYAALSSPANLRTAEVEDAVAQRILDRLNEGAVLDASARETWAAWALNRICEACRAHGRPFHLMVGVSRGTYAHGVPSGMDLFDSVNSLSGYDHLFNAYPDVTFPISVLSDTTGLEIIASAWIRHNVYPSGHWWYANHPAEISRELQRRLDVVPHNKTIGYYSDAYYLEFILPKFRMFKFELASVLAQRIERSLVHPNMDPLTIDAALELGHELLIKNPQRIVGMNT